MENHRLGKVKTKRSTAVAVIDEKPKRRPKMIVWGNDDDTVNDKDLNEVNEVLDLLH